jgi:hypothetical protein
MKIIRNSWIGISLITAAVSTLPTLSSAAPLPNGMKLTITPYTGPGFVGATGCTTGSCFGGQLFEDLYYWTPLYPGTDGGIVIGKNQKSGGQEINGLSSNDGETISVWTYAGNYGTFFTAPVPGYTTNGASLNQFDSASCSGAGCLGKTTLGTWHMAWGGYANLLGSADGCPKPDLCTPDQMAGIGVSNWIVNPDNSYALDYSWVNSGVGGFIQRFKLHLKGNIVTLPDISGVWRQNGSVALYVFGDNFATSASGYQISVNGVSTPVFQVLDKQIMFIILPSEIQSPFNVVINTPSGPVVFPKPCN